MYTFIKLLTVSLVVCFLHSCKKESTSQEKKKAKPAMTTQVSHKKPKLAPQISTIENWNSYQELQNFIIRFETTSPTEALSNANELKNLITKTKENIAPARLNTNAFRARLNTLHNEALRLYDMSLIPSISAKEVNLQVEKINNIYSNLNLKIESVFEQEAFDKEIRLDNFFTLEKQDSPTKQTSTTKKSKQKNKVKNSLFRLRPDRLN